MERVEWGETLVAHWPVCLSTFRHSIWIALLFVTGCVQNVGTTPSSAMAEALAVVMETAVHNGVESTVAARQALPPVESPAASTTPELSDAHTPTPPCRLWLTIDQGIAPREGPGGAYGEVGYLGAGQSAEVVGRDAFYTWWIIFVGGRFVWVSGLAVSLNDCANYPAVATPPPLP